ncbi:MAG: prepilin-type N-terminal cleavage/methylation domain-containing protein [Thermoanaerobaculia bacterium]
MRRRAESGVTLVELLIAVALLGFILLGIAPLFIASVKSNYSANEYTSIHNLARDRLEQLMTLPFADAQLAPGVHPVSDLPPTLPDPRTGVPPPPGPGAVPNPFELTYEVQQFTVSDEGTVATGAPFLPTPVAAAGAVFHYKRIDVTVRTRTGNLLGIGNRVSRVSGIVSNPSPTEVLSVVPLPTPTP